MRYREIMPESASTTFYHVTPHSRTASIRRDGLVVGKRRQWHNSFGAVLGDRKKIYLFTAMDPAIQLAARMEYGSKKPIDILVIEHVADVARDSSAEATAEWVTTETSIPPEAIKQVIPLTLDMKRDFVARQNAKYASTESLDEAGQAGPIYTIGDPEIYDPLVADSTPHYKLGRHKTDGQFYAGGAAFKTVADAQKFQQKNPRYASYHVYALDGTWGDVYWSQRDNLYAIKRNLRLLHKAWPEPSAPVPANEAASRRIAHTTNDDTALDDTMRRKLAIGHIKDRLKKIGSLVNVDLYASNWPLAFRNHLFFFANGEPVGFAVLQVVNPIHRELSNADVQQVTLVYFQPPYRSQGNGLALYRFLLDHGVTLQADTKQTAGGAAVWDVLTRLGYVQPSETGPDIASAANRRSAPPA